MEQKLNKEQLAEDYGNRFIGQSIAWAAAEQGFLAGWETCQQNLQQTACYTALELLQQMVGERSLTNAFNSDYHLKQKNYSEIDALRFVMELIKERQANDV